MRKDRGPSAIAGRLVVAGLGLLLLTGCAGPQMPARSDDLMPYPLEKEPHPDDIYHLPTGLKLSFEETMDMVSSGRLIFVGEMHNNVHAHRVQLEIIREMHRRYPGRVAIGMEMFREPQQESLDRWTRGELSEVDFLIASRWIDNWGSDFGYYRQILNFARDNRVDVLALNPSRELQRQVALSPDGPLPPEVEAQPPETDISDPHQREFLKAVFAGHRASDKMFDAFYRVQLLWEETMAQRIADYLRSPKGKGKKMVVLTGSYHIRYAFGIPKKVMRRIPSPYFILLPTEISIPEEKRAALVMDVDLPDIPLLPGDFVWMIPYDDLEDEKVRLGVYLAEKEGRVLVEKVVEDSAAEEAGIRAGDELLSIDGTAIREMSDVLSLLQSKKWGDRGTAIVRRQGAEETLALDFTPPPKEGEP